MQGVGGLKRLPTPMCLWHQIDMLKSMDEHMQPVKMIDVGHKSVTVRTAKASGSLLLQPKTLERILAENSRPEYLPQIHWRQPVS